MPETAHEWYERASAEIRRSGYRDTPFGEWTTWPYDGDLTPRDLRPPGEERARHGAGGEDCHTCRADEECDPSYVVWRDDLFMLGAPHETSLPFACFLMSRRHGDLADLTPAEAARMGVLMVALEQAACDVLDVPRIQVLRWGDGSEHLHWWLMARPTGAEQLRGTFLALWDDMLPVRPAGEARADLGLVAARLVELVGGEALPAPAADTR